MSPRVLLFPSLLVALACASRQSIFKATQSIGMMSESMSNPRGNFSKGCRLFPNKRIVLVTVNSDYFDMYKNWVGHAQRFLQSTEQLVVMAEDEESAERVEAWMKANSSISFTVQKPKSANGALVEAWSGSMVGAEAPYDSSKYGSVVQKRPAHILKLLSEGCSVLYSDIDNVWVKDPFLEIAAAGEGNAFVTDDGHNLGYTQLFDGLNYCTCFLYFQPEPATIQLMRDWQRLATGNLNQPGFNSAVQAFSDKGLKLVALSVDKFPPGSVAKDHPGATVFHANWLEGQPAKVKFFQERGLWGVPSSWLVPAAAEERQRLFPFGSRPCTIFGWNLWFESC